MAKGMEGFFHVSEYRSISFFSMATERSHSMPCPNLSNYAPIVSHGDYTPYFTFTSNGITASQAVMTARFLGTCIYGLSCWLGSGQVKG